MVSFQASSIRVLLVAAHQLLTDAQSGLLQRVPDLEIMGVCGTVAEARIAARERLDVVLMDDLLPDGTDAEATRDIKRHWSSAKVIMLTAVTEN